MVWYFMSVACERNSLWRDSLVVLADPELLHKIGIGEQKTESLAEACSRLLLHKMPGKGLTKP